jgi:hypothetical protein
LRYISLVGIPERKISPGKSKYVWEIKKKLIQKIGYVATERDSNSQDRIECPVVLNSALNLELP